MTFLAIQLFWFSFVLIGATALWLCKKLPAAAAEMHAGVLALICFATGIGVMVPPVTLAYIFEWQVAYLAILYGLFLAVSVLIAVRQGPQLNKALHGRLGHPTKRWLLNGCLVLIALGFDYAISAHSGGPVVDDTPVHLAKIQLFLNSHMTFADPFVGYNGILDLRYSANVLDALQAVIAHITGVRAYVVWSYSYAFYRFIIWISLFSLAITYLPKRVPREWSYIVLILCPFIYNSGDFFVYAELPHVIVLAWVTILLVGLKVFLDKGSYYIFLLAAGLIAATHALASLFTLVFLGALSVVLIFAKRLSKKQLIVMATAIILLAVPVIANSTSPDRSLNYGSTLIHGIGLHNHGVYVKDIHGLVVPKLANLMQGQSSPLIDWQFILVGLPLAAYVVLMRRAKSLSTKRLMFYLVILAGLQIYNVEYMSLVGYIFIFTQASNRQVKLLVLLATLYYGLLAYDPIVLSVAYNRLPLWFLARFQDLNMLAPIAPIIGTLVIYRFIARYGKLPGQARGYGLLVLIVLSFPIHRFPIDQQRVTSFDQSDASATAADYQTIKSLQPVDHYVRNQVIFTNDQDVFDYMVIASTGSRTGLLADESADQSQNIAQRATCQQGLGYLRLSDLRAAKITQVALIPGDGNGMLYARSFFDGQQDPYRLAGKLPYLKFETQVGNLRVYGVSKTATTQQLPNPACIIPYKQ